MSFEYWDLFDNLANKIKLAQIEEAQIIELV